METHETGDSRCISHRVALRTGLNLTPEFLVAGTETSGRLIAVKVTGKPVLAAIKEYLHCWLRCAHRAAADGGHSVLQRYIVERSLTGQLIINRELQELEIVQAEHASR